MAKARRLYSGYDSYGRAVEVAERTDGVWFCRDYGWNGYRKTWSAWRAYGKVPTFPVRVRNMCEHPGAQEYVEIPEEEQENSIEYGFSILRIIPGPHRIRLPD
jgi:hypothetical protein